MCEPIHVLHVLQRLEPAGVQTLLLTLMQNTKMTDMQFDFLVHYKAPQSLDKAVEETGGTIYRMSVREDMNFFRYQNDLKAFFHEHRDYQIVHGHMHSLGFLYLKAAKDAGVPVRIAHAHAERAGYGIKDMIKGVTTSHFADNATDLLACSQKAGEYMFGSRPFTVFRNAIDTGRFRKDSEEGKAFRKELHIPPDAFVIGTAGRFSPEKNIEFGIRTFREVAKMCPDSLYLIAGDGADRGKYEALVSKLGLAGRVLFIGARMDMHRFYNALDIFLMPSIREGLGIVGIEAQSCGVPVLATETLPEELDATNLLFRKSLTDGPKSWAQEILSIGKTPHDDMHIDEAMKRAGYDIRESARLLKEIYTSALRREGVANIAPYTK